MKIGQIIKLIRVRKSISQKDMAVKIGISQNYLSLIESLKRDPGPEVVTTFAETIGLSKEAVFFAASQIPSEFGAKEKSDFARLQNNIMNLLLFDSTLVES